MEDISFYSKYLNTSDVLFKQFLVVVDGLFRRSCSPMTTMLVLIHPAYRSVYENVAITLANISNSVKFGFTGGCGTGTSVEMLTEGLFLALDGEGHPFPSAGPCPALVTASLSTAQQQHGWVACRSLASFSGERWREQM